MYAIISVESFTSEEFLNFPIKASFETRLIASFPCGISLI